jgi:Zn-dependent oligopeptidase
MLNAPNRGSWILTPDIRCWEPKVLAMMSSHYEKQEPLPADLIEKIIKRCVNYPSSCMIHSLLHSRYVNAGLFYLRQLFFGTFDIRVHTDKGMKNRRSLYSPLIAFTDAVDYTKFWNELRESLSLVKSGKFTAGMASFNHLAGGYDAGTSIHPRRSFI